MKKLIAGGICFLLVFTANALEISAGTAVDFGLIFSRMDSDFPESVQSEINDVLDDTEISRWGFAAFCDARYFEANLGFKFRVLSRNQPDDKYEESTNFFNIGAKIKYPFKIRDTIRLFPLIGIDYSIFTEGKAKDNGQRVTFDRDDLILSDYVDHLSLNFGVGMDFDVAPKVYIRGEFNYTIVFNTQSQKDLIEEVEAEGYELSIFQGGPALKLAVGYRFAAR